MPERSLSVETSTGSASVSSSPLPTDTTISNRSGNAPVVYEATQSIEFDPGFESGSGDEFATAITTDNGSSSSGTGAVANGNGYRYGFNGKGRTMR